MALTEQQLQQLNASINKLPIAKIVEYIDKGFVRFPDDLPTLSDERRKAIASIINSRPNPQEQAEWRNIAANKALDSSQSVNVADADAIKQAISACEALQGMVDAYIAKWSPAQPVGHHVEEAQALLGRIRETVRNLAGSIEGADWQSVDQDSIDSLMGHTRKYPATCHQAEIERRVWELLHQAYREQLCDLKSAAERFMGYFPNSQHVDAPANIMEAYQEWDSIKSQYDLPSTHEYINRYVDSPFADEAKELFQLLKAEEIQGMKELQASYPIENLLYYLENKVFTQEELIEAEVATEESIQMLKDIENIKNRLPDVNEEIAKCKKVCAEDHTDVFLFGIPSTGKTCILMGLIGCTDINVDTVRAGGPYSTALDQYLKAGLTIGQTPKDFVATIEAEIIDGNKKHLLNLVEMSGEDFAFKIADNENGKISFEDMGNGATRLLCNDNRKVFFIIVDPTARMVAFNHLVEDEEGSYLIRKNVNQRVTLKRMVDLLRQPENKNILKKVEAINIIVTKSDTLGTPEERDQNALDHFLTQYDNIIAPLKALCKENKINLNKAGEPIIKVYSFSLGQFYVGGIYKYSDRDAKKLVQVLKNNIEAYKSAGFGDVFRNMFN